jgi:hypothetical protein
MTEGKGFCQRRQERNAEKKLKQDLENLDKIIVIENNMGTKKNK